MDTILIVEDNGELSNEIAGWFSDSMYDLKFAHSYISAVDRWEEYGSDIKCIIADLQIPPSGLDYDKLESYYPFFGMAFVNYLRENTGSEDEILNRIVLYSGYVDLIRKDERNVFGNVLCTDGITMLQKNYDSLFQLKKIMNHILSNN